jgi:hypothetical protein
MNIKATDIPKQQQFFLEYWNLYKKYFELWKESDSERQWELFLTELDMVLNAYKQTEFYQYAKDMVLAMVTEFERKSKR